MFVERKSFIFIWKCLYIFEWQNEGDGGKNRFFSCWFISQGLSTTRVGPGWSWELGTQSRSAMRVAGTHAFEPTICCLSAAIAGSWNQKQSQNWDWVTVTWASQSWLPSPCQVPTLCFLFPDPVCTISSFIEPFYVYSHCAWNTISWVVQRKMLLCGWRTDGHVGS